MYLVEPQALFVMVCKARCPNAFMVSSGALTVWVASRIRTPRLLGVR